MDRLYHYCAMHKLPVTHQKMVIYTIIKNKLNHPTPDEVFQHVKKKLPSISKATVYKNLNKFCEIGLMRFVEMSGVKRIDPNIDDHHHVINQKTGEVHDVYIDKKIPLPKSIKAKDIERVVINYYLKNK